MSEGQVSLVHPDDSEVVSLLQERQTLRPPAREPGVLWHRRQRMLRVLRDRLVRTRARSRRFLAWRRVSLGFLAFGTAATAVIAYVKIESRATPDAQSVAVNGAAGVGVGVVDGALTLTQNGTQRSLAAGATVQMASDDTLETPPTSGAELQLSRLVNVTLAAQTRVVQMAAQRGQVERITLAHGRAHLRVAKLTEGRRFHVVTPDADVQVRGTEFDVEMVPGATPKTCVRVQEGLVQVTARGSAQMVGAGQTWGCDAIAAGQADLATGPAGAPAETTQQAPAKTISKESLALRAQNRLFQRALRAQRTGDHRSAIATYRLLLTRYPGARLAAQARRNLADLVPAR